MNHEIAARVTRINEYLNRIREDMRVRNPVQAMADTAELGYQAGRLWVEFHRVAQIENQSLNENPAQPDTV